MTSCGETRPVRWRASPSFSSVSSAPARMSPGSSSPSRRAVHHLLGREDDAPQQGLVLDDADVALEVENLRQPVVERNQIAQAIAGFQLAVAHQLIGQRDAVDLLGALAQAAHALENAAVLLQAEVVGFQHARGREVVRLVHQDRPQHETLGVQICGKALLEGYAGAGHGGMYYLTVKPSSTWDTFCSTVLFALPSVKEGLSRSQASARVSLPESGALDGGHTD